MFTLEMVPANPIQSIDYTLPLRYQKNLTLILPKLPCHCVLKWNTSPPIWKILLKNHQQYSSSTCQVKSWIFEQEARDNNYCRHLRGVLASWLKIMMLWNTEVPFAAGGKTTLWVDNDASGKNIRVLSLKEWPETWQVVDQFGTTWYEVLVDTKQDRSCR